MTNREQSVIDDIDALVDEQLAGYSERSGYDYNVGQDRCPHCSREWHGLAITQRIEGMAWRGVMDPDYRYAEDDSPVLCPGSDFIGPVATPEQLHWIRSSEETKRRFPDGRILTVQEMLSAAIALYGDLCFATNPFVRNEIPVYPSAWAREAAQPEMYFRPNWWYDHGEISGADTAVIPEEYTHTSWNGLDVVDGDRVTMVGANGFQYTGIARVENYGTSTIIHLDEAEESRRIRGRGFTADRVIFDEGSTPQTPQERALPRPADRPPMWANDPARTRRGRNRASSIRTPRV